jgi:ketosteroid isomerase-like protein
VTPLEQPIRAAEIVGALSLATDLGTGQPLEHDCCIVFEVENGRMLSGREHFFDTDNWDEFWS